MKMTDKVYKKLHEEFVEGHNGTSLTEISALVAVPIIDVLLRDTLLIAFGLLEIGLGLRFLLDYVIIVLAILVTSTIFSDHVSTFLISSWLITVTIMFYKRRILPKSYSVKRLLNDVCISEMKPFISYLRSQLNIQTAVIILAVDFKIFPRRFAKTETFGTSFMDVGVGCFVIVNALVSPESRGKFNHKRGLQDKLAIIGNMIRGCIPLIILGGLRTLSVKGTDYQEHVSEYGVHWNFFLTLAAVKIISTTLLCIFAVDKSLILGVCITIIYEYLLCKGGLSSYILYGKDGKDTRQGIIDANREGLFSCVGYTALYLIGVSLGQYIFTERSKLYDWCKVLCKLIVMLILSCSILWLTSNYVEHISRRLCNAAYIVWMVVVNLQAMCGYLFVNIATEVFKHLSLGIVNGDVGVDKRCLMSAVNYNGLFFFLLANILTGLVNMSVETIYASTPAALLILVVYSLLLSLLALFLYHRQISIKL